MPQPESIGYWHEATDLGPLATPHIRDELAEQVARTISLGTTVLRGAKKIDPTGYFWEFVNIKAVKLVDSSAGAPGSE